MSELNFTPPNGRTASPPIEIRLLQPLAPDFAATLQLCGEHDISTSRDLENALKPIFGNVLVDLTECTFIDSTTITVIVVDFQLRKREGHRLELLVPPENKTIMRTIAVSGLAELMTVHLSCPDGARLPL